MNREISKKLEHVLNRTLQSAKPVKNLGETVVQSSFMEQNQMKLDMILQQRRDGGMVISQHVCEHRNYRVCFVENVTKTHQSFFCQKCYQNPSEFFIRRKCYQNLSEIFIHRKCYKNQSEFFICRKCYQNL